MASTFKELYDEFKDAVKIYTEKLDITETAFVRLVSRGMQIFQRETEYIEKWARLSVIPNSENFPRPDDLLRIVELKDSAGLTLVSQGFVQFNRTQENMTVGILETPRDYSRHIMGLHRPGLARIFTMFAQEIIIHPYQGDQYIDLYYIPNLHPMSEKSSQWNTTDPNTGQPTGWYPLNTRFEIMFHNAMINYVLQPYEYAFLNFAIAEYIKSQGNINYKVFEEMFYMEIEKAKFNKPILFKEGSPQYCLAPHS